MHITKLHDLLFSEFGDDFIPYDTCPDGVNGTSFRIKSIPAVFSVILCPGQPSPYDIQIDAFPSGDYSYNTIANTDTIIPLIYSFKTAPKSWPVNA